ncbi:hypothetical protein Lal_00031581 [Lupinus albus]|nr:hypothetical protein Lal_00031581 [Lupinus albus]
MDADNTNVGRNFGTEIDEVKGKMDELAQAQNRMEDTLQAIRDSLSQLTQNQGERNVGTRQVNEPIQEEPRTNVRFTIPIGEGYRPMGDAPPEGEVQVQPKMTMPEMCSYFMGTLGTPYIGIMAGVAYKDFRELMDAGDRIEMLTKAGKLSIGEGDNNGSKKSVPMRKKENRHLLAPYPVRPIESNFPHWYNANLTCSYHMDVAGHSIEDCEQFKMAVRKLMACGKLEFEDEVRPDISKNPIPNHNQRINAIVVEKTLVKKVSDLRVSMQCLFDTLKMTGYDIVAPTRNVCDEDEWDLESQCDYHHGQAGHSIENCWGYKARVQVLLNLGVIEVKKGESNYKEVDMVEKVTLRIPLRKDSGPERVTLRVRKPQSFAYESTHMIPWSYEVKVEVAGDTSKTQTSNAVMAGGIAKNGRFYGPSDGEVRKIAKNTEGEGGPIEEVTEKEEEEFLKIMRQVNMT